MVLVEISEYKGSPIIELKKHQYDTWPFRFGVSKAKLILECLDDIKKFVKDNDKSEE